jgi:hypothetical protein
MEVRNLADMHNQRPLDSRNLADMHNHACSGRSRSRPSRAEVCDEGFVLDLAEKEKRRARSVRQGEESH